MNPNFILEVCVDSLESAIQAANGGADRLEVCASLAFGGGITPSLGLVRTIARELPGIPLMVMVRPRVGDFVYSDYEIQVMLEDIEVFKALNGVKGVVLGALTEGSKVDRERTRRLAEAAVPLEVTFHRAFDMTGDAQEYGQIAAIKGISRVLTSGLNPTALQGLGALENLVAEQRPQTIILPGSGINPHTVAEIVRKLWPLGCREYHMSGGCMQEGRALPEAREGRDGFGMGGWSVWSTNGEAVREVRKIAERAAESLSIQVRSE